MMKKLYILVWCLFDHQFAFELNLCKHIHNEMGQLHLCFQITLGRVKFHLLVDKEEVNATRMILTHNYLSETGLICYAVERDFVVGEVSTTEEVLKFGDDWYHIDDHRDPMLVQQDEIIKHIVNNCVTPKD